VNGIQAALSSCACADRRLLGIVPSGAPVPTVLLVRGYRLLSARGLRAGDAALAVASAASVPFTSLIRGAMLDLDAFSAAAPRLTFAGAAMAA
jgi:hypothetical protein